MSSVTSSPNMSLPVPNVGVDTGPDWANNLNGCLSILDQHNHSSGSGVQIQPSGLNINANLTFANNQATSLSAVAFTAQTSVTTTSAIYVKGVDLYYRDGSSNEVQITTGGTVNATSSGITSGTNTASFVSNVLVVNSAATTPANIQAGSILIGNNVANSKFLTLAPPNAMAANYSITLPASTASTKIMTLDSSGNMAASYVVDNSTIDISSNTIEVKAGGIGTTQLANASVTVAKLAALNAATATSSGIYSTSSTSYQVVDNQSVSFTTTGRPIMVAVIGDGNPAHNNQFTLTDASAAPTTASAEIALYRGSTKLTNFVWSSYVTTNLILTTLPPSSLFFIDTPSASTYTYSLQVKVDTGTNVIGATNLRLYIYEL